MAWHSCSSICRDTATKRIYQLKLQCGLQSEPKSKISSEKSKKNFFMKLTQNLLKRIVHPFFLKKKHFFEKKIQLGWDLEKFRKIEFFLLLNSTQNVLKRTVNLFF